MTSPIHRIFDYGLHGLPGVKLPPLAPDRHVRRSGSDYAQQFLKLLPYGQAWPRHPLSTLALTVEGLCNYWGFVDSRAADLLETESDPRLTLELLTDWERNWGLPDPCITNPPTDINLRHAALVAKMTMLGAQSRAFFYHIADLLGYTISITEFSPYICGISQCGDTRGIDPDMDPAAYRWQLGPPEIRYYWTVHVNSLGLFYARTGSAICGITPLLSFNTAQDLECVFDKWKPAHTQIVWDYSQVSGLDFTLSANSAYIPLGII